MSSTEERIAHLVARACAIDPKALRRDRSLTAYGLDSVRAAELAIDLEQTFGISIPDEDLFQVRTIELIAGYIDRRLHAAGGHQGGGQ